MKYIQSFYNYAVTFTSIGKTFPSKDATAPMRNVMEISEDEYKTLMRREPMFRSLVERRKYRVLDYMPDSAKPDATRINEAKLEAKKARQASAEAQAKNANLAAENEALKARIAELEAEKAKAEPQVTESEEKLAEPIRTKKPATKKK